MYVQSPVRHTRRDYRRPIYSHLLESLVYTLSTPQQLVLQSLKQTGSEMTSSSTMTAVPEADDNVPTIEPDAEVWTAIPVMDDNIMNIPTLV